MKGVLKVIGHGLFFSTPLFLAIVIFGLPEVNFPWRIYGIIGAFIHMIVLCGLILAAGCGTGILGAILVRKVKGLHLAILGFLMTGCLVGLLAIKVVRFHFDKGGSTNHTPYVSVKI